MLLGGALAEPGLDRLDGKGHEVGGVQRRYPGFLDREGRLVLLAVDLVAVGGEMAVAVDLGELVEAEQPGESRLGRRRGGRALVRLRTGRRDDLSVGMRPSSLRSMPARLGGPLGTRGALPSAWSRVRHPNEGRPP